MKLLRIRRAKAGSVTLTGNDLAVIRRALETQERVYTERWLVKGEASAEQVVNAVRAVREKVGTP